MKVAVVYCYPLVQPQKYFPLARRFTNTWKQFPGYDLHVVFNGGFPEGIATVPFNGIPYEPHVHNNLGWDVGAFQSIAEQIPCDLLVCLGAPVHFHKPGWLAAMADAYIQNGPGLYGCWGYHYPTRHIRTTVFWLPPELLNSYPYQVVSTKASRYAFEHGADSLTAFTLRCGFEAWMVTRSGCYPHEDWHDHVPGVQESLVLDQHIHV